MRRGVRVATLWAALLVVVLATPVGAVGVAVEGRDWARIQLPAAALVEPYQNSGYRVSIRNGVAEIEVELAPLASRDPFRRPREMGDDAVGQLARRLLADASSRYEAVSRVLSWVSREIEYDLDREQPQDPEAVLVRRSGYCTGIARLVVSLLERAEIPAREVAGLVVSGPAGEPSVLYHRWVEIEYSDRGWVFSDPMSFHNYVPAHYVRLASEELLPQPERDPAILRDRLDQRKVVDLAPLSPSGVSTRRNSDRQLAGSLAVQVEGGQSGVAVLEGQGKRLIKALVAGQSTFVGLEPGEYRLTVMIDGEEPLERELVFHDYVREAVVLSSG